MFIDHGDVKVIKSATRTYWVYLESFGQGQAFQVQKLSLLIRYIRQTHKGLVRNVRDF